MMWCLLGVNVAPQFYCLYVAKLSILMYVLPFLPSVSSSWRNTHWKEDPFQSDQGTPWILWGWRCDRWRLIESMITAQRAMNRLLIWRSKGRKRLDIIASSNKESVYRKLVNAADRRILRQARFRIEIRLEGSSLIISITCTKKICRYTTNQSESTNQVANQVKSGDV